MTSSENENNHELEKLNIQCPNNTINEFEVQINNKNEFNLNFIEKFAFAFVGVPFTLMVTGYSVFASKYLLDVAKIPPFYTSFIMLTRYIK